MPKKKQLRKKCLSLPNKYISENFFLAQAAVVATIAMFIYKTVQAWVGFNLLDSNVLALILGVIFAGLVFLTKGSLKKSSSEGILMAGLTVAIISSLSGASLDVLLSLLLSLLLTVALTVLGIILFAFIAGKILKEDPYMAIAIGAAALFGFPGTYIVANEVSHAVGETEEEVALLEKVLQPKMLVAGFTIVSIGSILIGGIMSTMLIQMFG